MTDKRQKICRREKARAEANNKRLKRRNRGECRQAAKAKEKINRQNKSLNIVYSTER